MPWIEDFRTFCRGWGIPAPLTGTHPVSRLNLLLFTVLITVQTINPRPAQTQSNTASVTGIALDPDGRAIPGATVTVRNTDLATRRTILTDSRGAFRLDGLVPGAFTLEAASPGLALKRPIRLTIGLGSNVRVSLTLTLPIVSQRSTVTARAATQEGNTLTPAVNKEEASTSSFFPGTVVTYLPNRDRDFTQFGQLGAGITDDQSSTGIVVAGQRSSATLTQVDGASFNDPLHGGRRGAADRTFFLPQTIVREFQIVRSGVTAEVGGTGAGLINVVTKEGSNKLHGEAFYTVRPTWATSSDAFGHHLDNRQNTFGASFGGPLRKDRLFFYTGFEQDILQAPTFTQFASQAPSIAVPSTLTAMQGQIQQRSTPTAGFLRTDTSLNPNNSFNLQIAVNRIRAARAGDGSTRSLATAVHSEALSGQSVWSKASLTSLVNEHSVNQALLSWSQDHRSTTPLSSVPEIDINGFGTLGGDSLGPHLDTSQQYQVSDALSLTSGARSLALGMEFNNNPAYEQQEANLNGRFDYNSLNDFLAGAARRYQQTFVTGSTRYAGSTRTIGLFANGRMPLGRRLTLTAGLRWDAQLNPQPPHPNPLIVQTQSVPNDRAQWQPRLGLAWSPLSKTVVRAASGLYTTPTPATLFHRVTADNGTQTIVADSYFDPQILPLVAPNGPPFAAPPRSLTTPSALIMGIDHGFRNPRSLQFAASAEQEIKSGYTLSTGYLHASTWRLDRRTDLNLSPPAFSPTGLPTFLAPRPNPAIGRLLVEQSNAHSSYNALLVTSNSQISRRSQITVNYTFAKTTDDDSNQGPYSIDTALNPYDLAAESAPSSLDVRHVLNISAIFNLPYGFKCNPLFLARSGRPYTPIIGFDTQHDANDFNDRALIGGTIAQRNSFRQPAFTDLDLRLVKDFTLPGTGHHLDLFMDIFNLGGASNRNFGREAISLYGTPTSPMSTAGTPLFAPDVTVIGGPREIQFTARLVAF